jgi:RNA-binding protein YlmH
MTKEEQLLARHFEDLSKQAQNKGIITYSGFLNLNERNIFQLVKPKLHSKFAMSGGYEYSERQMIAFIPDALFLLCDLSTSHTLEYPIICCKVEPLLQKFSDDWSHRDILGSLINLGVERSTIGDILVTDGIAYFFCQKKMWPFFNEELTRVRHTPVKLTMTDPQLLQLKPKTECSDVIVTSNRLDSLVAALCKLSRSHAADLIKSGKVFINNREVLSGTYSLKDGELISIRSYGRFIFHGLVGETKKGRCKIRIEKYL